ncbi:MAG TPA: SDR family oxidoreductase [Caulobacteraceae bacterium]|jgi:nucleoside-diphosphate-sugar epimerase|nr:SDR family oxidoreductase [Caulobacteraceae bacterium]
MRVFLTGATGFIGSAVIPELIDTGHQVLGLTRSEAGAEALAAAGAEPHRGDLEDLDSLRSGAAQSDGVIHCAFVHDFSKFQENSEIDRRAIEAIGQVLAGSDRPFIVTSGVPFAPGGAMTEDTDCPPNSPTPRVSEPAAMALLAQGVSAAVVRLPQVHDTEKQGLVTPLIGIAREKGVSAYVGDGQNGWPAAHVSDVARLYRLALDQHKAGARWHAIGEDSVRLKDIAEAIGRGLKVPVVSLTQEEAGAHLGFFGAFAGVDLSASSALTQQRLGWRPTGPGMIEDLDNMQYVPA